MKKMRKRKIKKAHIIFLFAEAEGQPVTGVFTLNDLMRAQAALLE